MDFQCIGVQPLPRKKNRPYRVGLLVHLGFLRILEFQKGRDACLSERSYSSKIHNAASLSWRQPAEKSRFIDILKRYSPSCVVVFQVRRHRRIRYANVGSDSSQNNSKICSTSLDPYETSRFCWRICRRIFFRS